MADAIKEAELAKFSNLSSEDFDYVKADFDDLDADKSGSVSFEEVKAYLASDGGISEHECEEYMKQYDLDGDGVITLTEYLQCMGYKLN
jgi:calcium-dependent protein kinase